MPDMSCKCQVGKGIELNEFDISHYCMEDAEKSFAQIVGCIESIIISEPFMQIQTEFMERYYKEFVDDEENRLIYMDIFNKYLSTVEKYIEEQLMKNIPGFNIKTFELELERKPNELDAEIYDMLSTFWDFQTFKQMFLEYKNVKDGNGLDLSKHIKVTKYDLKQNQEKMFID